MDPNHLQDLITNGTRLPKEMILSINLKDQHVSCVLDQEKLLTNKLKNKRNDLLKKNKINTKNF